MKPKTRLLALLLALVMICSLSACGEKGGTASGGNLVPESRQTEKPASPAVLETATPAKEPASATRSFTDSTGRTVELPAEVTRIAVSGPMAQIVLFSLAPEKLVGVANSWDKTAEQFLDPKYYNLPVLGQLYGGKGELNLEELLAADPDVVIDVGEPKGDVKQDMDDLSEQTGIPFVHITAYTESMDEAYTMLGELLSMEAEAGVLADYCNEILELAKTVMGKVGEEKRCKVLYLLGSAGLNVIAKGSYHGEILDMLTDNLAVLDNPSSKGTGNETDMEQLLLWNPELILFAPGSVYAQVGGDAVWQQLDAVAAGRYYEVPFGPYNWMGFPPSVQRYLGILWLCDLLYPEAAELDLYSEVARYFSLFYHCKLTQAQFDSLMQNAG